MRSCLDFTANKFKKILFCLFEPLLGIFALSFLANRPLFAANRECKSTQKAFSTKLEIKSKQLLCITPTKLNASVGYESRAIVFLTFVKNMAYTEPPISSV